MKQTNLIIIGFISLVVGVIMLLVVPYNILKSKIPGFIFLILGTFLIIVEIVTYHKSMLEK